MLEKTTESSSLLADEVIYWLTSDDDENCRVTCQYFLLLVWAGWKDHTCSTFMVNLLLKFESVFLKNSMFLS